ncbi:MAG: acetyl-CoA carboxylase biotin carboxyl carrier protein [Eubacteriaceae bacterium]|jgi:acetyl-CoA carboxylase biotin carboxyl carrier protein|nr:acetyl-CoA carboxylase biotin carboxyl carrier protein [Eubacteriaceae bacterium]
MDTKEIMALMDHFDTSHAVCLKIREGNLAVTLKKAEAYPKAGPQTPGPAALFTAPASPQPEPDSPPEEPGADPDGAVIRSPLVGTFYHSASPDEPPFVTVGQTVHQGETIGLLEAMKMMSEVPAPFDCVIEEILVDNGTLAAFDQPLMRVREL